MIRFAAVLSFGGLIIANLIASPVVAGKPNIVLILTDDLGYGDVGCYGATRVKTPHIDRIAREGVRFTDGYAPAATCTPTRFAMLTGQYAWRIPGTGIAPPNATALIQPDEPTLASMLSDAGYATGIVGKWHLGLGEKPGPHWNGDLKPGPLEIGFDHCYLMPTTGDRVPCVYVEGHRVVDLDPNDPITVSMQNPDGQPTGKTDRASLKMNWSRGHNSSIVNGISRIGFMTGGHRSRWVDEDMADRFAEQAVKFIDEHHSDPFFLFFSLHDIHVPRVPHPRFQGSSECGIRGDAIVQVDWQVGQILAALDQRGLTDDTLVIFGSDNGPVLDDGYQDRAVEDLNGHRPSGPLRGGKYSPYEGGTRTPFLVRWPKRVQPAVSEEIVCLVDLPASLANLVDQPIGENFPDSLVITDALLGKQDAKGRSQLVIQGTNSLSYRDGDWKIVAPWKRRGVQSKSFQLFNLADDLGEQNNLAKQHPERLRAMKAQLKKIRTAGRSRTSS
ncbi:MAG: arylsulfatase [Planctomycetaceae bacterium]|nr:arylsulfatase [Planctomycetaceae bacterium]